MEAIFLRIHQQERTMNESTSPHTSTQLLARKQPIPPNHPKKQKIQKYRRSTKRCRNNTKLVYNDESKSPKAS